MESYQYGRAGSLLGKAKKVIGNGSDGYAPRALVLARGRRRAAFETADSDAETRDRLIAGDGRTFAITDCVDKRRQFGPQRLIMSNGKMPHGIAAVRLEPEALGDL